MEDDDEIQSHPSPDSGSPLSPPSNGRITVTVAAAPPPSQKPLTLALPIQQGRTSTGNGGVGGGGGGVGGGREDCWSEGGTKLLIDAWGERYLELSRGNLKQKHWKEVADVVSRQDDYSKTPKTDIQCKNRIDTVKKKYKAEKAKISAGGGPSKWLFYERLDYLIGPTAKIGASPITPSTGALKIVPVGIPVAGSRSAQQFQQQKKPKQNLRRRAPVESDSSHSDPEPSPDSTDSFPPDSYEQRKRPRIIKKRDMNSILPPLHHHQQQQQPVVPPPNPTRVKDSGVKEDTNRGNSVRELTRAIIKFGEAFEQAETSKLQQVMEMEKQRMKFTKELELQRMKFYMKTQLELSQIKRRKVGNNNNNNHHHLNNNNNNNSSMANNNNNNSESSS